MAADAACFVDVDERVPMPLGWSPYPAPADIAEFEALMAELPTVERDEPAHPSEVGDHPVIGDLAVDPVAALSLLAGEGSGADGFDLCVLQGLDLATLTDPADKLAVLKAVGKVEGLVAAVKIRALTALGGTASSGVYLDEVHLEHEIAAATRTSDYAAGKALDLARTITTTFPGFLTALVRGRVSWGHLAVLVDRTRFVTDPAALTQIADRALARALTRTAGQFATEVEKLVARFDPDAAERHRKAKKKDRKVWVKRLADGMGMLGYVDEWSVVNAVYETIAADARASTKARQEQKRAGKRGGRSGAGATPGTDLVPTGGREADDGTGAGTDGDQDADEPGEDEPGEDEPGEDEPGEDEQSADSARADALAARVLGTLKPDGSVVWDRAASTVVQMNLTMDFLTLTRERDRIALLDGQPIPAEIAREHAASATTWRRFVTDPATDHLIDVGTRYTDAGLHRFILARDICRNPVHQHSSSSTRLQMDHAEEAPHGPTSAANCGGVCIPSHQLKTARLVDITDSRADGSCTWTTVWGQVVHIPPRAFLDHPDPPVAEHSAHDLAPATGAGPPTDADPPPF